MSRVYASTANALRDEWTSGQRLERYLYEHGKTKAQLSRESGVALVTLYRICNGDNIGSLDTWNRIAAALGCTVSEITGK